MSADLHPHLELATECWTRLGDREPFFSVITDPAFRGLVSPAAPAAADFYATGVEEVERFRAMCSQRNLEFGGRRAVDFGCGVGRLTLALAPHFDQVTGVDISRPHLRVAEARRAAGQVRNVDFYHSLGELPHVPRGHDFCCAVIVLQHLTPPLQERYIEELCRGLAAGGVAILHVLVEYAGYRFDEAKALGQRQRMQMHALDLTAAIKAGLRGGAFLVGWLPDPEIHGPGMAHRYLIFRRPDLPGGPISRDASEPSGR